MPYTNLANMTDRYGLALLIGLTDRATPPDGVVATAVVDRALADTDAVIDGYLAGRYALPLAVVPGLIADLAAAIAIWKLHTYDPDPKFRVDYDAAMKALREIALGVVRIPVAGLEPTMTGGTGVRVTDRDRPFTAATMTGFI